MGCLVVCLHVSLNLFLSDHWEGLWRKNFTGLLLCAKYFAYLCSACLISLTPGSKSIRELQFFSPIL